MKIDWFFDLLLRISVENQWLLYNELLFTRNTSLHTGWTGKKYIFVNIFILDMSVTVASWVNDYLALNTCKPFFSEICICSIFWCKQAYRMIQDYAKSNPNFSVQCVTANCHNSVTKISWNQHFCDEVDFT